MLDEARLVAFAPTTEMDRAREFYVGVLGLEEVETSPYALVLRSGDTTLRVTKVDRLDPQPFTVLGWTVADIKGRLAALAGHGIRALRYDGLGQDELGIWTTPGGDQIAWFKDPDGNVLSFSQHA